MVGLPFLIQKQIKRYELIRTALQSHRPPHRPVITFSREPGSGGRLIAQIVAGKLGFSYYDRNLVDLVAQEGRLSCEIVRHLDEKKTNNIIDIISTLFGRDPLPNQAYIRALSKAVLAIAAKGSAVIVGRGANFLLGPDSSLSVRIVAPLAVRIRSNVNYDHMTEKQASVSIRKIHVDRRNFVQKYFSKNIASANYYDLVINTRAITVEDAAELVVGFYHHRWG